MRGPEGPRFLMEDTMNRTEQTTAIEQARRDAIRALRIYSETLQNLTPEEADKELSGHVGQALRTALRQTVGEPIRLF